MKRSSCYTLASLATAFSILSACKQHSSSNRNSIDIESLLERKKSCNLSGGEKYDSTKYISGWNAAYAYSFIIPKVFKDSTIDVFDKEGVLMSDTSYAFSPDKHAAMRMWVGKTVSFPLGAIGVKLSVRDFARADSAAASIVKQIKKGRYPYFKNAKIDDICYGYSGYSQRITLLGHTRSQAFICKTDISELPVSGDLIEKNIVFKYGRKFKQYRKMGLTVVNEFSGIR